MSANNKIALYTALIYFAAALGWIIISDYLVFLGQAHSGYHLITAEVAKGSVFVLTTSIGLYLVLRYQLHRRRHAEAQLEYHSNILQNVSDAIIAVDFDYRIQSWNPGAEAMYGWRADEVMGKVLGDLIKPSYDGMSREQVIAEFQRDGAWQGEALHHRRDGTPIHAITHATYLRDSAGKPIGIVAVNRDVTDQKRLQKEMVEKEKLFVALENERKLQEVRTHFMRMVSHEFRTPLTIIHTACDILGGYYDRMTDQQRQDRLDNIAEQVVHLRDLLNDLSVLLNTDSAQPDFTPAEVELVTFWENQIAEIQRGIGGTHTLQPIVNCSSVSLKLDTKLMRHVINNLVFNAIKYSPSGSSITVSLEDVGGQLIFKVADQGIGIPPAEVERIFEPFYRAGNVEGVPGSGLGLAIVKQIVELHEGEITVDSRLGEGTTFTVKLPLKHAA